ncbi:MAG: glycosyltransferase family 2 protein [Desulfobacteraceae bacterium]|nr:glycosyltransferase family 2 protein [Desulfobacteraceae bacterium]
MTAVSVIIPTYNRARKLLRAISSVLYQTFIDYEVIVVDDGSNDGTAACLEPVMGRIEYLRHPDNMGVSAARNKGIKASRYPFIAFLDSDDYWLPKKLSTQMDFFKRNPEAVACQTEEIWIRKGLRVNPRNRHLKPSGEIFVPSLKLCLVSPSAVVLKRSLLDEVGLFDEDLPACEDYDLWLRISCRYPIHLIPRRQVVKEGGFPDQLSSNLKGLDLFRIKALVKLLRGGQLTDVQLQATLQELTIKCQIYGSGCLKRGKKEEGEYYLRLPEDLKHVLSKRL